MFHVEHVESIKIRIVRVFSIFLSRCIIIVPIMFALTGCKSEDPNPELKDPIYKDLSELAEKLLKESEAEEKNYKSLLKEASSGEIRTLGIKLARKKLRESKKKLVLLKQKAHFYKIRAEHRKLVGRKAYRAAFKENLPWPDPAEHKRYLVNKKLREVDLNWNKRVPKLQHANPNYSGQEKPSEK